MKLPVAFYPNGGVTDGFFMSREAYERLLRGLVRDYSNRVHWLTGTVTGLNVAKGATHNDEGRIESATVRTPGGEEQDIFGSLIIGEISSISFILETHQPPSIVSNQIALVEVSPDSNG